MDRNEEDKKMKRGGREREKEVEKETKGKREIKKHRREGEERRH